jgi:hypothetical protein
MRDDARRELDISSRGDRATGVEAGVVVLRHLVEGFAADGLIPTIDVAPLVAARAPTVRSGREIDWKRLGAGSSSVTLDDSDPLGAAVERASRYDTVKRPFLFPLLLLQDLFHPICHVLPVGAVHS